MKRTMIIAAMAVMFSLTCMACDAQGVQTVSTQPQMERYDVEMEDDSQLAFQIPEFIQGDLPIVQVYAVTEGILDYPTTRSAIDFRVTDDGEILASVGAYRTVTILLIR